MYINNAIYTSLKHYPELFLKSDYESSRFAVLVHIFLCSGGDYDWKLTSNGWAKVEIFQDPPDEEGDPHTIFLDVRDRYITSDYGFEESVEFLKELESLTGHVFVNPERKVLHIAESIRLLESPVFFDLREFDYILRTSVKLQCNINNQIDVKNIEPECKASLLELLDYLISHPNHLEYNIRKKHPSKDDNELRQLLSLYQYKIQGLKNLLLM